jgi:predicted small lipoprotein YifL
VQVDLFLSLAACYREGPLGLSKPKKAISTALTRLKILLTPKKEEILDVIAS